MLNCEVVEVTETGVEIVFSDPEGDECIRIYLTRGVAWDLAKEIGRLCSYKRDRKRGVVWSG